MEITVNGKEVLKKEVKMHKTGGILYLPKTWVGKTVLVVLEGE